MVNTRTVLIVAAVTGFSLAATAGCTSGSAPTQAPTLATTTGEAGTPLPSETEASAAQGIAQLKAMQQRMSSLSSQMMAMGDDPSREQLSQMMEDMRAVMRDMQFMLDRPDFQAMGPDHMKSVQALMAEMESMGSNMNDVAGSHNMGDLMSGGMNMSKMMDQIGAMRDQLDAPAGDQDQPTQTPTAMGRAGRAPGWIVQALCGDADRCRPPA